MEATRFDADSRARRESPPDVVNHTSSKGKNPPPERFSPKELLLLVILVAIVAQGAGILLEAFLERIGGPGGMFIHFFEMVLFLVAACLLLYLPLKRRLAEKEKAMLAMLESKKHLQEVMQEREQHLQLALEGTSSGLWDWDLNTGMAYYSSSGEQILGYQPGELEHSIKTWENLINPEDHEQVMKRLNDHLEGRTPAYESEHRIRSKSGEWIWFHAMGKVTARDKDGRPLRMIGTFNDITDRKNAETELHLLWQNLDRASENERARVAQDLHDQLGQMVTGLQLGLGVLKREQDDQCQKLVDLTTQLSNEIRSVTSRLRPPALETGLVPALEYDLTRLRRLLHDQRINLHAPGLERERMEPEAEITLFRVYQEALNNAVKHSQARTIDIRLQKEGSDIILAVKDDGTGFDVQQVFTARKDRKGIGLLGMQERVAALGGRLEVISKPGRGTTIMAILPFKPHQEGMTT